MKKIIIVTFLFSVVFFAGNIFSADYGRVTITERQPFGSSTSSAVTTRHGYAEYRFLVQNRDSVPHRVKISMTPGVSYGGSEMSLLFSTDTVEVAAGSSATLRLFQPPIRITNGSFQAQINIDGWLQRPNLDVQSNHMERLRYTHGVPAHNVTVCFSQQVPTTIRDFFARRSTLPPDDAVKQTSPSAVKTPTVTVTNTLQCMYSNVPVDDWSDLWVSYTRFDCVVLTSVEWSELLTRKPSVLTAIKRYVEAGGMLVMLGKEWEVPAEWESVFKTSESLQNSASKNISGVEKSVVCGKVFVIGKTGTEVAENAPHFDNILKQIDLATEMDRQRMDFAQHETNRHDNNSTVSRMHGILPVVEKYGVNIRLILVLIIVFAVLIGPVNVLVLRSINRRIWLIWTVPATSLIASFLVLSVSFLSEGILRQSSSLSCTVLDQRRGSASTFGVIGYYSTFSPGNLNFSSDVELLPFLDNDSGTLELRVNSSGNQVLMGGWILPRVPAYFSLRKNQLQQKLQVAFNWEDANNPTATNGLGVKIDSILVCSPTGEFYEASNINPGEQKGLVKKSIPASKLTEVAFYNDLRDRQHRAALTNASDWSIGPTALFPCSYKAEIKAWNPFIEQGIPNTKPFDHKTTIIGIYRNL
ncbi:MAG: hypothetical protein LBT09_08430 [Planctomycetaceae bacterium]|jgi:hypothetical protein|nr:hypothetical protein [Planctomycetaceae bacterium]